MMITEKKSLALLVAALIAFMFLVALPVRGQVTLSQSVPIDVQLQTTPDNVMVLYGVADTAKVTYKNQIGTPLVHLVTYTDSVYNNHNENKSWQVAVTGRRAGTVSTWAWKLTRDIYTSAGRVQDTCWCAGDSVTNHDPFNDDRFDITLSAGTSVGDRFTVYFRTVQPLKVDGNRLLQLDVDYELTDSLNTY